MKANVKMKRKGSILYFQIGLIAIMVITLIALEHQFVSIEQNNREPIFTENPPLVYDYIDYKIIDEQPVKQEIIEKPQKTEVKPQHNSDVLEVVENEVETSNQEVTPQDNAETVIDNNTEETEIKNTTSPTVTNNVVLTPFSVEKLPLFPQCEGLSGQAQKTCFDEQLYKAILKNLQYPEKDLRNGQQGTALVEFIINENGQITNVTAIENRRSTEDMQEAAIKAVKKLPKLIPAKQGNQNVKVKFTIPIIFKIQ